MNSVLDLKDKGIGKQAVIFATGHSYIEFDYIRFDESFIRFEINKMRMNCRIDYSIYYDREWRNYFDKFAEINRELMGFRLHPTNENNNLSRHCNYWYDTFIVPFSDSGFHCLYIASEIMKFNKIFLVGYDYCKKDKDWHPYKDDFVDDAMSKKKDEILDKQRDKFKDIEWQANVYNCNKESTLKVFPFGLPYKN